MTREEKHEAWQQIKAANENLQTVDIKGKAYVQVNTRVLAFRELYPTGTIETELLEDTNGVCTYKATIRDEEGRTLATGHANEKESSSYINKASYHENCETSAIGRALAFLGIGVDASICSAEELVNAVRNQGTEEHRTPIAQEKLEPAKVMTIKSMLEKVEDAYVRKYLTDAIYKTYKVRSLESLTQANFLAITGSWDKTVEWARGKVKA